MRSTARRLVPVIVFALVLGLVMTGILKRSEPRLALGSASASHGGVASGAARNGSSGLSASVGAIPGVSPEAANNWKYASSTAPAALTIAAKPLPSSAADKQPRLGRLLQADVLAVAPASLPARLLTRIRRMAGVRAAVPVDAGRIQIDGVFVNVLGVDPTTFRPFAARPTARSAVLWRNIAAGGMAISYTMGSQDRLSLTKPVTVTGARTVKLPVAGFGTVGIGGVDAVVSTTVGKKLGLPSANAVVISAPGARLDSLMAKIKKFLPASASVAALVTQVIADGTSVPSGAAGAIDVTASQGPGLTTSQMVRFLSAAESRVGMRYVWGGAGPTTFDCSGLVQWSMKQAGLVVPRVAADQARTGPLVPLSEIQPGDLIFYHTDPTAPNYISHVAIYLGNGLMLQAPEPGMDVEIVRADFGAGFAGAVRVYPKIASSVALNAAG